MTIGPEQVQAEADLPAPLVIPRPEHPVSRKDIDREALKVMYRLRDEGFTAYLVGGGVRDLFLGKRPKDFDISTDAKPGQLRKIFRNSRIIGKRFRLVQVFFPGGKIIEVATFRQRGEYELNGKDEVLAPSNTFGSPVEDAFRRDLTINALFYEIETYSIIDYTGGVADLRDRVVRLIGDPDRRLIRDPVRMLRVIRHAARSGFTIEAQTWGAIVRHREELAVCPVSRIRDELIKDLRGGASQAWLRLAAETGLFFVLFPCYQPLWPAGPEPEPEGPFAELYRIMGIIDRLGADEQQLSEQLLFGLLLLPWAKAEFDLLRARQGEEGAFLASQLREALDRVLDQLSIKRATKEAITLLMVNLSSLQRHAGPGGWPKWLRRKSYFSEALFFFQLHQEAAGGVPAPAMVPPSMPAPVLAPDALPEPRVRTRSRKGGRSPVLSTKKGGIFGLKK